MSQSITVRKLNLAHELTWSYPGLVLERTPTRIKLEARFNRDTMNLGYAVFEQNDRFVECFFADRWYNIFEIHSVLDDHLKGWYCNIAKPAVFHAATIEQVDLALDVWINSGGSYLILDQDEFDALTLDEETRLHAQAAIEELLALVQRRIPPFDSIA